MDLSDSHNKRKDRALKRRKILKLICFALFLMYPAVSASILNFYLCTQINGVWYLINDCTLHCFDADWNKYLGVDIFFLFVYPIGIPAFIFYLLFRARKRLRDPANLQALGFLYEAYNAKQWWFELVDMANKFFLTSLLAFFPVSAQMPVGMVWIILYTYVILFAKPYVRAYDDRLHLYANCHLFLIMLMALTLQNVAFEVGSTTDVLASLILLVVLGLLILILLYNGYVFVRKFIRNRQRIQKIREEEHLVENPMKNYPEFRGSVNSTNQPIEGGVKENVEMVNPLFSKGSSGDLLSSSSKPSPRARDPDNMETDGSISERVERPRAHTFARPDLVDAASKAVRKSMFPPTQVSLPKTTLRLPPPQMIQPVVTEQGEAPQSTYVYNPASPPPMLSSATARISDAAPLDDPDA